MKNTILDIDHLMVSVKNSQAAGETFERMGFTLTPRSELPGMSNRLICFEPQSSDRCNFVEFLGFENRAAAPAMMEDVLGDIERPVSMVMVTDDMDATHDHLERMGFEPYPVMHLKRDWTLPSGEVVSPQFEVSIPKAGTSPLFWNVVRYKTPEHYRRPEFTTHTNTAIAFGAVLAVTPDADSVARHYERAWNANIETDENGILMVATGRVPLRLMSQEIAARAFQGVEMLKTGDAAYLGFAVSVSNFEALRNILAKTGVPLRDGPDGALWVPPEAAHGCVVLFESDA